MVKGKKSVVNRYVKTLIIIVLGICTALPALSSMLVRADDALPEVTVLKIPDGEFRKIIISYLNGRVDPVTSPTPTAKLAAGEVPYDSYNLYSSDIQALNNLSHITIKGQNVTNLTGLAEYLYNLNSLQIQNVPAGLDTVDISALEKLESVILNNNNIKRIILGNKPLLKIMTLENNKISEIDLSSCVKLENFIIRDNPNLTSLDLSSIHSLVYLDATNCSLNTINLGMQPVLTEAFLNDNAFIEIDTSGCPKLERIFLDNSNLSSLDFTNNTKLYQISFANNQVLNFYIPKLARRPYPQPDPTFMAAGSVQYLKDTYWYWQNPGNSEYVLDLTEIFTQDQISRITNLYGQANQYSGSVGSLLPVNYDSTKDNYYGKTGKVIFNSNLRADLELDISIGGVSDQYKDDHLEIRLTPIVGVTTSFVCNQTEKGSIDKKRVWFKTTDVDKSYEVTATPKKGYKFKAWHDKTGQIVPGTQGNPVLRGTATANLDYFYPEFYADKNDNNIPDDEEGSLVVKKQDNTILSTFWLPKDQNVVMNDYEGHEIEQFTMSNTEIIKNYPNMTHKVLMGITGKLNSENKFIVSPVYKDDRNDNGFADDDETHYKLELKDSDLNVLSATPNKDLLLGDKVKLKVNKKNNYLLKTILVNGHDLGDVDEFVVNNTIVSKTKTTVETIVVEAIFVEDKNNNGIADSEEIKYNITLDKIGEGQTTIDVTQAIEGVEIHLAAQPKENYSFKGWKSDDVVITDGKFTMPKKAVKITAIFEKQKTEDKPGGGNVTPTPGDGNSSGTIIIKPSPDGKKPTPNPDGTVTIPDDSTVILPGGVEVTLPNGGAMQPNGTVELPAGGSVVYPNGKVITVVEGGTLFANGTITDKQGNILMTLPKTGDVTSQNMYLGFMMISMMSLGFVIYNRKIKNN